MNSFDVFILKWKFKKIAIAYIIAAFSIGIGCMTTAGIVFQDRISFAWQYACVKKATEHSDVQGLQAKIDKLANSSPDVVDILMLDSTNNVLYSAKNSEFGSGQFNLSRSKEDRNYLLSDINENVVFKYVRGEEFMLASVFNRNFDDIKDEYDDESFFEYGFSNKTVYMLNYLGEKDSGNKVYIISDPTTVAGGMLTLKIVVTIAMLFFMIYWVLLALWTYQNAAKAKLSPRYWGGIVLLTNIAGVIVYLLYKSDYVTCPKCEASQNREHLFCTNCGIKLGANCKNCEGHISKHDKYCPHCGKEIK